MRHFVTIACAISCVAFVAGQGNSRKEEIKFFGDQLVITSGQMAAISRDMGIGEKRPRMSRVVIWPADNGSIRVLYAPAGGPYRKMVPKFIDRRGISRYRGE